MLKNAVLGMGLRGLTLYVWREPSGRWAGRLMDRSEQVGPVIERCPTPAAVVAAARCVGHTDFAVERIEPQRVWWP
ncbi:MAG: hypothetical protein ACP5P4_05655 [Steroidobacteraceae bacterium]